MFAEQLTARGADRVSVRFAVVLPAFPSVMDTSLMEIVGAGSSSVMTRVAYE